MTTDLNAILLALAGTLFAVALIALIVWAFRSFVLGRGSGSDSLLKGRDKRLGLVERAPIDGGRTLMLIRRDDVEHLIMTGGPVDMVIETGIRPRRHFEPPLELKPPLQDVLVARSETRPVPDYGKS